MTPEELAFFEIVKKVIYRFWWDQNKTLADCPYTPCSGMSPNPYPDDGISYDHDEDCALKDAMLAYWAMQDTKSDPRPRPKPPMVDPDEDYDGKFVRVIFTPTRIIGGEVTI